VISPSVDDAARQEISMSTRTALFSTLILLAASSIAAATPDPNQCIKPNHIVLSVLRSSVPDPIGDFTIVVRDAAGHAIPFALVEADFSPCPDIFPAAIQPIGETVDCSLKRVSKVADSNGQVQMNIVGAALNRLGSNILSEYPIFYANGVDILHFRAAVLDLDGVDGLDPNDLALWESDAHSGMDLQRSDITGNGTIDGNDGTALYCDYYLLGQSQTGAKCDGTPTTVPTINAGHVNLSWDDCYDADGTPSANKNFSCASNSGRAHLLATVIPQDDVPRFSAYVATIDLLSSSTTGIPSWWNFNLSSPTCNPQTVCRPGSLGADTQFNGPTFCFTDNLGSGTEVLATEFGVGGPQHGRITLQVVQSLSRVALNAGQQYGVADFFINFDKTTGTGACNGCHEPMCLTFSLLRIYQTDSDPQHLALTEMIEATTQQVGNVVTWQGPNSACGATRARNTTWGSIKSFYR
jgi:hypothetical protein